MKDPGLYLTVPLLVQYLPSIGCSSSGTAFFMMAWDGRTYTSHIPPSRLNPTNAEAYISHTPPRAGRPDRASPIGMGGMAIPVPGLAKLPE